VPRARALLLALVPTLAVLALPATAGRPPARKVVVGLLPGMHNKGLNADAEPALAVAPDGVLWATSNALSVGCGRPTNCGSDIWRSRDGGRKWEWVANPFLTADPTGNYAMGGGDGDITVASAKNATGHYNIYVASLWVSNAIAVSRDGGESWEVQPLESPPGTYDLAPGSAPVTPPDAPANAFADRPWIGADGACTVLFAYNEVPGNVTVMQRYDACQPVLAKAGASLPFVDGTGAGFAGKVSGRFVVDTSPTSKYAHAVYYPAVSGGKVGVQVSTDGATWTHRTVAPFSDDTSTVPIWPVTAATDVAGRLYVAWHDTENAYFATSRDGGVTWTDPVRLNPPKTTAVYPTVAAGPSGTVVVLWYGTGREGPANDKEQMGAPASKKGAAWAVYESRSTNAGRSWSRPVALTGTVHRGVVCVGGGGCARDGSRNLLDDFGVVLLPHTSRVVSVYTTDQPGGQRTNRKTGFLAEVP
jgi:hypothetical protein